MTVQNLTVTDLNRQIRLILENDIGLVTVEGEISNLSTPSSGHIYFTLKDEFSQIRAVFFKNRNLNNITIENGKLVIVSARPSIYEARGDFQLIIENIKDAGAGNLFKKFEALKEKLHKLGLFDASKKLAIPKFPTTIGIITSPKGAAIHDMLTTLKKRYPIANIIIYATEVQGIRAHLQIINALKKAHKDNKADVLLLARGGGSIEDLWAFNEETLAFEIANSTIPIVSGVGHETDFTIADFVADYRAATPTAAAQKVSPDIIDILATLHTHIAILQRSMSRIIEFKKLILNHEIKKLASPKYIIIKHYQALDYANIQLQKCMQNYLTQRQHKLALLKAHLIQQNPQMKLNAANYLLKNLREKLIRQIEHKILSLKISLNANKATLNTVSPLETLNRGYAIVNYKNHVLLDANKVNSGDIIDIRLKSGALKSKIIEKKSC